MQIVRARILLAIVAALWVAACSPSAVQTSAIQESPQGGGTAVPVETSEPGVVAFDEPAAYSFVLTSSCGERSLIGRFLIRVEAGTPVLVEPLDEAASRFPGSPEDVPTIGALLAEAEDARNRGADIVTVEADPVDGHPTSIEIDWDRATIDDEACYAISDYAAAAPVSS